VHPTVQAGGGRYLVVKRQRQENQAGTPDNRESQALHGAGGWQAAAGENLQNSSRIQTGGIQRSWQAAETGRRRPRRSRNAVWQVNPQASPAPVVVAGRCVGGGNGGSGER